MANHLRQTAKTLLATAVIPVYGTHGVMHMKALIDQGSTNSFISESAVQKMKLAKQSVNIPIVSINDTTTSVAKAQTAFTFGSCYNPKYRISANALIVRKISTIIPAHSMEQVENWNHILGLQLADSTHANDGTIDILLGAEICAEIFADGLKKGPERRSRRK